MKKFIFSYLACLIFFSIFTSSLLFIIDPEGMDASGSPLAIALLYIMYGSIPVLIGCLLGEFSYRKVKKSYKLSIGIPLFILLGFSYAYLMSIGLYGRYLFHYTMLFINFSLPIILSSLVFYFIRRIN